MSARGRRLLAAALDAATYALVATVVATVVAAVPSLPLGYGLVGVKYGLFLLGFVVFGAAIIFSWPDSAWRDANLSVDILSFARGDEEDETAVPWVDTDPSGTSGSPDQTPFQAFVQQTPPARFLRARPGERLPTGARLFLAALAIHATSFALEVVLGVPG